MKRHLLKQVMIDNHDTMDDLAVELGINANTLYVKMAKENVTFKCGCVKCVQLAFPLQPTILI